jgi:uncharacterized membrane protein
MEKLTKPGRIMFALGIIALSILGMISKDFIIGRPPAWPVNFGINPALAYTSGFILILAAIAILFNRKAVIAALIIAILIFFLSVLRHLTQFMNDWLNAYKAIAFFGGALVVAGSFQKEHGNVKSGIRLSEGWRKTIITTGCFFLAIFFIACGFAHFKFAEFINSYIPSYIPFHPFWTYFCGVCLFAGGLGLLLPQTRRLASLLSAIMIGGWFIFLHIPRFITNMNDPSDRMGLLESFTFVGIFFVLAGLRPEKITIVTEKRKF